MKIYAVVDACNAPYLLDMLKTYNPLASCLYNPPLQDGMAERAPYLIELVSDEVKAWLAKQTKEWGLYLVTEDYTDFFKLRNHLRKYTFAMIPDSEKPVFFRFYDPRVFWKITEVLNDWQLHAFLGPIEIVATHYDGKYRQDHFEAQRKQFPNKIGMKTPYLTLSQEQFNRLNRVYENEYIQELANHMMQFVDLSIIEQANNDPDTIHKEMLEHERDVKRSQINNPADQEFLIKESSKNIDNEPLEKAYFQYSNKIRQWQKIEGNQITPPNYFIAIALHKLARNPISEEEFHQLTNFEYANQNYQSNKEELEPTGYQNGWNHKPYFYYQNGIWYYVDQQEYAHPINDERVLALKQINQQEISESDFHKVTKNRYQEYLGLAYLPEEEIIEDIFKVTSMEELEQAMYEFAKDFISFGERHNITLSKSYKRLSKVFILNKYYRFKDLPPEWLNEFLNTERSGDENAIRLYLRLKKHS